MNKFMPMPQLRQNQSTTKKLYLYNSVPMACNKKKNLYG